MINHPNRSKKTAASSAPTTGPWKAIETERGWGVFRDSHTLVAALYNRPQPEQAANARLIAEAPELLGSAMALATARLAKEFSENAITGNANDSLPITIVVTLGDIRRARASIAAFVKAHGGTE